MNNIIEYLEFVRNKCYDKTYIIIDHLLQNYGYKISKDNTENDIRTITLYHKNFNDIKIVSTIIYAYNSELREYIEIFYEKKIYAFSVFLKKN